MLERDRINLLMQTAIILAHHSCRTDINYSH